MNKNQLIVLSVILTGLAGALLTLSAVRGEPSGSKSGGSIYTFTDVEEQTAQFHAYYRNIELTPAQAKIFEEALAPLPAPCCGDRSALTCCCPCNMAKSWWGLAKHLIAEEGRDAAEVRVAVREWFEFINPEGFSGDVCYTGGCNRAFRDNGCGGMNDQDIVF